MDRVNEILNNHEYKLALQKNQEIEKSRIFCKHGIEHQLDVARIAYIISLEKGLFFTKEVIYAAALLHDIGRYLEYEGKLSHEQGSVKLAKTILADSGFNELESSMILDAIENHRNISDNELSFNTLLYKADKMSRNCFECSAKELCNWSDEKKNKKIII